MVRTTSLALTHLFPLHDEKRNIHRPVLNFYVDKMSNRYLTSITTLNILYWLVQDMVANTLNRQVTIH